MPRPATAATPAPCVYNNNTYPSGSYVCIGGKCKQCVNGSWVSTDTNCDPHGEGDDCSPELALRSKRKSAGQRRTKTKTKRKKKSASRTATKSKVKRKGKGKKKR